MTLTPPEPQALQIPPMCQPQPLPMVWYIDSDTMPGFTLVTIFDASGERVLTFSNVDARAFITDLDREVPRPSGLVVPS